MADPQAARAISFARAILKPAAELDPTSAALEAIREVLGAISAELRAEAPPGGDPTTVAAPVTAGGQPLGVLALRFPAGPPPAGVAEAADLLGLVLLRHRSGSEDETQRGLREVAHELRTPLTAIRSFAEMLLSHEEDPATIREYVTVIHDEAVRLSRLVNGLLDLAHLRSGRAEWDFRREDLSAAVRRAIRSVSTSAGERGLVVSSRVDPDVAPFTFDRDRIIQVLVNLLGNAVRHSPPGGSIVVAAHARDGGALVRVLDQGPGVAAKDREAIFRMGGARGGLGLSICRDIVTAHGGTIGVTDAEGGGACFYFVLPASPPGA